MSKTKNEEVLDGATVETTENAQQAVESGKAAFIEELLTKGSAVLEAPTREALAEMVNDIPADVKYSAGAVGRKGDGTAYTLKVETVDKPQKSKIWQH